MNIYIQPAPTGLHSTLCGYVYLYTASTNWASLNIVWLWIFIYSQHQLGFTQHCVAMNIYIQPAPTGLHSTLCSYVYLYTASTNWAPLNIVWLWIFIYSQHQLGSLQHCVAMNIYIQPAPTGLPSTLCGYVYLYTASTNWASLNIVWLCIFIYSQHQLGSPQHCVAMNIYIQPAPTGLPSTLCGYVYLYTASTNWAPLNIVWLWIFIYSQHQLGSPQHCVAMNIYIQPAPTGLHSTLCGYEYLYTASTNWASLNIVWLWIFIYSQHQLGSPQHCVAINIYIEPAPTGLHSTLCGYEYLYTASTNWAPLNIVWLWIFIYSQHQLGSPQHCVAMYIYIQPAPTRLHSTLCGYEYLYTASTNWASLNIVWLWIFIYSQHQLGSPQHCVAMYIYIQPAPTGLHSTLCGYEYLYTASTNWAPLNIVWLCIFIYSQHQLGSPQHCVAMNIYIQPAPTGLPSTLCGYEYLYTASTNWAPLNIVWLWIFIYSQHQLGSPQHCVAMNIYIQPAPTGLHSTLCGYEYLYTASTNWAPLNIVWLWIFIYSQQQLDFTQHCVAMYIYIQPAPTRLHSTLCGYEYLYTASTN